MWEIEVSDEFSLWYADLNDGESLSVSRSVDLLGVSGPTLGRPHADTIQGSAIPNLKELRVQYQGRPIRILYVFDRRRVGYLILGGDKTGDADWYDKFIPKAERIYAQHVIEIGSE